MKDHLLWRGHAGRQHPLRGAVMKSVAGKLFAELARTNIAVPIANFR